MLKLVSDLVLGVFGIGKLTERVLDCGLSPFVIASPMLKSFSAWGI